jgi:hypothetical protein
VGLAKRGTRRSVVGGVVYRWVVSPDDGYMVLVAELADEPGQRLEAYFRYQDVCEPEVVGVLRIVGQRRAIRPGVVLSVIQAALSRGWQPSQRGLPPFRVLDADQVAPVGEPDAELRHRLKDPRLGPGQPAIPSTIGDRPGPSSTRP